jgi:hypothetical protein
LARTDPAEEPLWKNDTPQSETELYFIGVSCAFSTAAEARQAAREDAFSQILKYYGEYIQAASVETTTTAGTTGSALESYLEKEEDITRFAQGVVSQVGADNYYTEVYFNSSGGEEYIVYVLCQIPRQKAEQDIRDFARNISERYGSLLVNQQSLAASLKMYAGTAEALRQNPLHRATAYYDSPNGRAGLYEYCLLQLNNLAHSVSFAPLPSVELEKGETLKVTVRLLSSLTREIGNISCRAAIVGVDGAEWPYSIQQDNSFPLEIYTTRLNPGRYTVQLELLLNEIVPGVALNPSAGFSFEVKPLNTVRITGEGEDSRPLFGKVGELFQAQGLLVATQGGAYLALVSLDMQENRTANYYTVQPVLSITVELERDGTPLMAYRRNYPLFRHVTREEAYARAYRNIEQDLSDNFAAQIRSLER